MKIHLLFTALAGVILLVLAFSCTPDLATSSNVSDIKPMVSPQYTTKQVLEIARNFSPDCRKKIPSEPGTG
jgi:hypothetical protein